MKKGNKGIPLKNYLYLCVIFLIVFCSYYYLIRIYKINQIVKSSVLNDTVATILADDFASFIIENPDIILYFPNHEENNDLLENNLKEYIIQNHLENKVYYLNIKLADYYEKRTTLLNDYASNHIKDNLSILPKNMNIFIFEDGKINQIMYFDQKDASFKELIEEG